TTWKTLPVEAKQGFGDMLFPAGYVFQHVQAADVGLLFKTFTSPRRNPASRGDSNSNVFEQNAGRIATESETDRTQSNPRAIRMKGLLPYTDTNVAALIRENSNTIIAEIRKFLAILRHANESEKQAA